MFLYCLIEKCEDISLFISWIINFNSLTTNVSLHIETSQLMCIANQLNTFCIIGRLFIIKVSILSKFPKYPGNTELIYWWDSMIPQVLQDIIDLILLTIGPLYRERMKYGRILWKARHYALVVFPKFKSRWPGVFCRKAALKIFAKSKENLPYQSAFCNNVVCCRSATLSKETLTQAHSC